LSTWADSSFIKLRKLTIEQNGYDLANRSVSSDNRCWPSASRDYVRPAEGTLIKYKYITATSFPLVAALGSARRSARRVFAHR
jgi:hypothetical protein